ncbi:TLPH-like protein [Mya arenaria]|uniref:TLPH-like protein n=1 Tax=Mya arenaria TaxID=6604 RepID=A0ABY7ET09_MYAAR|nr:TLPH-like protein [Mya arenaria]
MWTLVLVALVAGTAADHQLRIHNGCGYEIWVGLLGRPWSPDRGGFKLSAHQRRTSIVPNKWSGRVWGRTHCHGNRCETGDCGRGVHCNGAGGEPPATLAEITFDAGGSHNQDFYDISLVDGYNLQMSMSPVRGSYRGNPTWRYCARAGCNTDLNKSCPQAGGLAAARDPLGRPCQARSLTGAENLSNGFEGDICSN